MDEIILLHVSGDDKPGITATLNEVLASHGVFILDMNQAVIHQTLLLGIMMRLPRAAEASPVLRDLLFATSEMNLQLRMTPVKREQYDAWVGRQGLPRYILTLLSRQITAEQVARVSRTITDAGMNIDVITRLTGRPSLDDDDTKPKRACMEFSVRGQPIDNDAMSARLVEIGRELSLDLAWQRDDAYRRVRRLVAFDMDNVLIEGEVITELAREAGVLEQVNALRDAAKDGSISFEEGLIQRVALLEGLDEAVLKRVYDRLAVTEGAERLITNLKRFGYKTAMISGGFNYFAERLKDRLGINYASANRLEIAGGQLTGRITGQVVTGKRKADILKGIASIERIRMEQVIAVGDGPNDLPMLGAAGLGIAFHAPPPVADSVGQKISTLGLDSILYLIGIRDRELLEAAENVV